jgi:LPXTG-site transpeptidase (sortase) family protein
VGSDVPVGHVSYRGVPGAFARLHELRVGDPLTLDLGSAVTQYRVTSADAYPKDLTPLEDLYDPNGPARLVLITCGGEFSTLVGHYDENIVVTAVPA